MAQGSFLLLRINSRLWCSRRLVLLRPRSLLYQPSLPLNHSKRRLFFNASPPPPINFLPFLLIIIISSSFQNPLLPSLCSSKFNLFVFLLGLSVSYLYYNVYRRSVSRTSSILQRQSGVPFIHPPPPTIRLSNAICPFTHQPIHPSISSPPQSTPFPRFLPALVILSPRPLLQPTVSISPLPFPKHARLFIRNSIHPSFAPAFSPILLF